MTNLEAQKELIRILETYSKYESVPEESREAVSLAISSLSKSSGVSYRGGIEVHTKM